MKITVIRPVNAHSAYKIAAETFAALAEKIANVEALIVTDREIDKIPPTSAATVIVGSDAANAATAELYLTKKVDGFGIRYGTDDYFNILENAYAEIYKNPNGLFSDSYSNWQSNCGWRNDYKTYISKIQKLDKVLHFEAIEDAPAAEAAPAA